MLTRLAMGGVLGLSGLAWAEPPTGEPVEAEQALLGGPAVEERPEGRATLVRWGYDGRLERLETTPEQAAVELLELTPMQRDAVDGVLARRMAVFDEVVIESLDLAVRFDSARALKDWGAMRALVFGIVGRLGQLIEGGPARVQIAEALPAEEAERFEALVDEYYRAMLADEKKLAEREGRRFKPIDAALTARGAELEREVERAIKRSAAMGDAGFDIFLQAMGLAPEVESMIRQRSIAFANEHNFNPSKEAEDGFYAELFVELDRESRVKIMSGILRYQSRGLDYGYGNGAMKADEKTGG